MDHMNHTQTTQGWDHTQTSNEPGTKQREDRDKTMTREGQDMEKTVNWTDKIGTTLGEYRHTVWTSKEGKTRLQYN